MLKISQLTKSYKSHGSPLFKAVDCEVATGGVIQVIGPNGVGKTTFLKCLAGYLDCDYKKLSFKEKALHSKNCAFASTDDHSFFPKLSLQENLNFFTKLYGSSLDLQKMCESLGLRSYLQESYQTCSTGIKKRLAILRAAMKDSPILLLDEPFANMDPQFQKQLINFLDESLKEKQTLIIFSSNDPQQLFANQQTLKLEPWEDF